MLRSTSERSPSRPDLFRFVPPASLHRRHTTGVLALTSRGVRLALRTKPMTNGRKPGSGPFSLCSERKPLGGLESVSNQPSS